MQAFEPYKTAISLRCNRTKLFDRVYKPNFVSFQVPIYYYGILRTYYITHNQKYVVVKNQLNKHTENNIKYKIIFYLILPLLINNGVKIAREITGLHNLVIFRLKTVLNLKQDQSTLQITLACNLHHETSSFKIHVDLPQT